jgi:hypothetical protein
MNAICSTVLDAIGDTPMVSLAAFGKDTLPHLYAKLECTNPGGSMKDRAAKGMIEWAELNLGCQNCRMYVWQHGCWHGNGLCRKGLSTHVFG